MTRFAFRFLWTTMPHFKQGVAVMTMVCAFGVWTIRILPGDIGAPYVLLLFCQLFVASSGLGPMANAGYVDAALVRGVTRVRLALCHWVLSVGPGMLAWWAVSGIEAWSLGADRGLGARPASLAAMVLVSNVTWLLTLPANRFIGGTVWLLAMGAVVSSSSGMDWVRGIFDDPPPPDAVGTMRNVAALLTVPFVFLVPAAQTVAGSGTALVAALGVSAGAVALGVLWCRRRDFSGGV